MNELILSRLQLHCLVLSVSEKSRNVNININAMILLTVTQPLTSFLFFSNCDELDFKVSDQGPI